MGQCGNPRFVSIELSVLLLFTSLASAQQERKISKLAEGVYAIQHKDEGALTSGNTTVIIGDRQVFVVDTCFLPANARQDVADIPTGPTSLSASCSIPIFIMTTTSATASTWTLSPP